MAGRTEIWIVHLDEFNEHKDRPALIVDERNFVGVEGAHVGVFSRATHGGATQERGYVPRPWEAKDPARGGACDKDAVFDCMELLRVGETSGDDRSHLIRNTGIALSGPEEFGSVVTVFRKCVSARPPAGVEATPDPGTLGFYRRGTVLAVPGRIGGRPAYGVVATNDELRWRSTAS